MLRAVTHSVAKCVLLEHNSSNLCVSIIIRISWRSVIIYSGPAVSLYLPHSFDSTRLNVLLQGLTSLFLRSVLYGRQKRQRVHSSLTLPFTRSNTLSDGVKLEKQHTENTHTPSQLFGNPSLISRVIKTLSRVVYRGLLGSILWLGINSVVDNSLHLYCGECRCLAGRRSAKWSGLQHWLWLGCVRVDVWGSWFIQGWPRCSSIPAERHFVGFVLWCCQPTYMWLAHKPSILLLQASKINRKEKVENTNEYFIPKRDNQSSSKNEIPVIYSPSSCLKPVWKRRYIF